ncbi:RlpA-like double-psi beta-barrel-protein domain-containing protein-containing protein [Epithele typhae]|uniref:RlpA-like double-psi beta-barrel-protein domain-containing protein-containing protein n=1 Tax=Epithele typhae TaxID=378194 RepID=UPI0020076037|nr:RlpA-like double-psi beta-barrel-protein domain-containing protein-containing protein [Epithele typhae]KAH9942264.1 RlpA-like double-psi beta-barrel-protein domain-containing protein-containing protein [Epithele typhae]
MSFKTLYTAIVATLMVGAVQAFNGDATFYEPNGGTGACGHPIQNTDFAVALNPTQYAGGANCGRTITAHFQGASVTATVQDLCPGCGNGGIDLTPSAFQRLASLDRGRIQVEWDFN